MSTLTFRRNPLRNVAGAAPWTATVYLLSYLPVGLLLFCGVLTVVLICGALNITWLGVPLLVGAAAVVRGAAELERRRAALIGAPIEPAAAPTAVSGVFARVRTAWRDMTTWRACAYLLLLFPLLFLLDALALGVWLTTLAGVTLPLWFWSVPTGRAGHGARFGFLVDNVGTALLAAVGFAVLAVGAAYVLVGAATLHATVARILLGPRIDPLAEARRVLAEPGPLAV
jgi:hypothetical protein